MLPTGGGGEFWGFLGTVEIPHSLDRETESQKKKTAEEDYSFMRSVRTESQESALVLVTNALE